VTEKTRKRCHSFPSFDERFTGLASALVAGGGIGDLPPVVQPDLVRGGRLVEVMPNLALSQFSSSFRSHDETSNYFPY